LRARLRRARNDDCPHIAKAEPFCHCWHGYRFWKRGRDNE
jgi:hypothetical protein